MNLVCFAPNLTDTVDRYVGMVHGDIKPQNVLIFFDDQWTYRDRDTGEVLHSEPEIVHAKLADFGYAGWNTDPSKEVFLYLPESKPWTGPEYHHRAFEIQQAQRLEIFSFGLLCLWFLFHDKLESSKFKTTTQLADFCHKNALYSCASIEKLKRAGLLSQLASELVRQQDSLDDRMKQDLIFFFLSCLNTDAKNRSLQIQRLVSAAGYEA